MGKESVGAGKGELIAMDGQVFLAPDHPWFFLDGFGALVMGQG